MTVISVPFPTSLMAEYIHRPGEQTAAIVYTGSSVFIAIFYNALWWHVSYKGSWAARYCVSLFSRSAAAWRMKKPGWLARL